MSIQWNYLHLIKNIYHKPTLNLILKGERQCLALSLRVRQGCLLSPLLSWAVVEVLTTMARKEGGVRGMQVAKGKVKSSPFTDDMIMYVENSKESTKKNLLEQMP